MDPLWRTLATQFRSWTGMIVPDTMRPAALREVGRMAEEAGLDALAFLRDLDDDRERRQALLDAIGLGTTWFLREEAGLLALVGSLARVTPPGQDVFLWSAGCSSGEEPYSLAMALAEAGLNAHILATDLNRRALRRGFDGVYPRRAIERLPAGWCERYFEDVGPDTVRVCDRIRGAVTFELHNFRNELRLPPGWSRFDAVVCRNVLIYFDRDEALEIIDRLAERCRPSGYLLLSAVERPLFWMSNVATSRETAELVQVSDQRVPGRAKTWPPVRGRAVTPVPLPLHEQPTPRVSVTGVLDPSRTGKKPAADPAEVDDLLARAETAERTGALSEAMSLMDTAVARAPLAAPAHLARGLLLKRVGRTQEAIDAFRAARFLDARAWMAPYQLALCLEVIGESKEAEEAYRHALGVLETGGPAGLAKTSVAVENLATTVAEVCRNRLGTAEPDGPP